MGWSRGVEETRPGTKKRCCKAVTPAWWSADNCSIFLTVNILIEARSELPCEQSPHFRCEKPEIRHVNKTTKVLDCSSWTVCFHQCGSLC